MSVSQMERELGQLGVEFHDDDQVSSVVIWGCGYMGKVVTRNVVVWSGGYLRMWFLEM